MLANFSTMEIVVVISIAALVSFALVGFVMFETKHDSNIFDPRDFWERKE